MSITNLDISMGHKVFGYELPQQVTNLNLIKKEKINCLRSTKLD